MKLVCGPRKTFILGFAVSSKSIIAIARKLLERNDNKYDYVLTYRFSQDQAEMFFSKIRSSLGWNNNPTALQFKWALRTLLQKNQITAPTTGNCKSIVEDKPEKGLEPDNRIVRLFDSSFVWRDDVLGYIGGYIAFTFTSLEQHSRECHILDQNLRDDHITRLIHAVSHLYTKIFLYRFGKMYSEKVIRDEKPSKKQKLNKLIIFAND